MRKNFGNSTEMQIVALLLSPGVFNILKLRYGGMVSEMNDLPDHWFNWSMPIGKDGQTFRRVEILGTLTADQEIARMKACEDLNIKHLVVYTCGESVRTWTHLTRSDLSYVHPDIDYGTARQLRQIATPDPFILEHWESLRLATKNKWDEKYFAHVPNFWQSYAKGFDAWVGKNFHLIVHDIFSWNPNWAGSTNNLKLTPDNCYSDGTTFTPKFAPYISMDMFRRSHYPYLSLSEDFMSVADWSRSFCFCSGHRNRKWNMHKTPHSHKEYGVLIFILPVSKFSLLLNLTIIFFTYSINNTLSYILPIYEPRSSYEYPSGIKSIDQCLIL